VTEVVSGNWRGANAAATRASRPDRAVPHVSDCADGVSIIVAAPAAEASRPITE
jgi:hypothetical protein